MCIKPGFNPPKITYILLWIFFFIKPIWVVFCPEITTKVSKMNIPIYEVPIKYKSRNIKEGKKIRLLDGFHAVCSLIKYRFTY